MNEGMDIVNRDARWEQVKQIFHTALEEPTQEQDEYVQMACAGDLALQREVERLIAYDRLAGFFMEEPAAGEAAQAIVHERGRTVEQFSEDICRHLEGLPVIARKDTLGYRTGKFIQSHKTGVGSMALILVVFLAGIIATQRQVSEIHRQALSQSESLLAEVPQDVQARRTTLIYYKNVGDMLLKRGSLLEALGYYQKEFAIAETLATADPNNAESRSDLALSCSKIGELQASLAIQPKAPVNQKLIHWCEARSWFQKSLDIFLSMRDQGTFRAVDAGKPDRINKEIARCDAALARYLKSAVARP